MNNDNIQEHLKPVGDVEIIIKHKDGTERRIEFKNTVLRKGREALAASLANEIGDTFDFFICRMVFGNNGTTGGVPKSVNADRNGLFGPAILTKPVISNIDYQIPSQVVFTSIIDFDEANGFTLNEIALQMSNDDYYSLATFADLNKTSLMQITWNWRLSFV